jgi:hypothetical protein
MGPKDIAWLVVGAVFLCFVFKSESKEEESPSFKALNNAIDNLEVSEE